MTYVIFEVFLFLSGVSFLLLMFPMFKTPVSQAGMLVAISLCLVTLTSMSSSFWFPYILFLVYIGGLLVLFIYVCLVSSNYPFKLNFVQVFSGISLALIVSEFMPQVTANSFLGFSTWVSGAPLVQDMNVGLFIALVLLLLFMLLVVVRSTGVGSLTIGA